jgi:type IV pilus assembly protein PilB
MYINDEQLQKFLVDAGLLSKEKFERLAKVAEEEDKVIGEVLVSAGALSDGELRKSYAYLLGVPFIDLTKKKIDYDVLSMIPEPIARNHNIIAFKKSVEGGKQEGDIGRVGELEVAMLDTDDLRAVNFIRKQTGLRILPRLTNEESIKSALKQYHKSLKDDLAGIIDEDAARLSIVGDDGVSSLAETEQMANQVPAVRIVDALLQHAIVQGASDIHIEPHEENLLVRYRIDGILHDAMELPKSASGALVARIKVLANLKLDEKRLPQDGRFKMESAGEKVALRVSVLPTHYGEKVVMRLLKDGAGGFTLEGLGFSGDSLEAVHKAMRSKTGIILITGPTGSGKTTTLYSILDLLNTPDVNISTIEDPIEYQLPRINQTQVHSEIGLTFAGGLRSLMRQDPDIIMVGEIRDKETASLAINAALTGHLVLSTLHTNSAAGAVARLVDLGVEPFLLVSTLQVVIGQRLVRALCNKGKGYHLSKDELEEIDKHINMKAVLKALKDDKIVSAKSTWKSLEFYRPEPGKDCETGYSGRRSISEVLSVSPSIKELIIAGASDDAIEAQARKEGMFTMLEDGIMKAAAGATSIEEVLRVVSE